MHMMTSQYQLNELISFIGRKKLKQLGLLPCTTCAHILWDIERLSNPLLDSKSLDSADHLFSSNNETTMPSSDDVPHASSSDHDFVYQTQSTSHANEGPFIEVVPLASLSPIVLEDTSHESLGIGFIYNPFLTIPPHATVCAECGRLYSQSPAMHSFTALPVVLSDVEYEVLKGFYVDISL